MRHSPSRRSVPAFPHRAAAVLAASLVVGCSGGAEPGPAPDTRPPEVVSTTPEPGAADVATGTPLSVTFDEPVRCASAAERITIRRGEVVLPASWVECDGATVRFGPATRLGCGAEYTVTVEAIEDDAGNPLEAPHGWSFTTAPAPAVVATVPGPGATGVPIAVGAVSVTWSKPLRCDAAPLVVRHGTSPAVEGTASCEGSTITFAPSVRLSPGTEYVATAFAVEDTGGEIAEADHAWTFTTAAAPAAPSSLIARSGNGNVTLEWDPVSGATTYDLYFASAHGVSPATYGALPGGGRIPRVASPFVHPGLENGRRLRYVVTATGAGGEGPPSTELAVEPVAPTAWEWQDPWPTGADLYRIHAVSADEAWIVGEGGTLVHATDGGATLALVDAGTSADLWDVSFVDSAGWVSGHDGVLLHTADAGSSWSAQALGAAYEVGGIQPLDRSSAWVAAGALLRTQDGGLNWTQVATPAGEAVWDVQFVDTLHGVAHGGGAFLTTSDGGASWAAAAYPAGASRARFSFASPSSGVGIDLDAADRIFVTADGGASWTPAAVAAGAWVRGVSLGSSGTGWAVGPFGTVLRTSDGGASWTLQSTPTRLHLTDVVAIDALHAWAVGEVGAILRTTDGGATWTLLGRRALTDDGAHRVSFGDASRGLAHVGGVGSTGGTLLASGDGGATWSTPVDAPARVMRAQLLNGADGFLLTSTGNHPWAHTVYRTADGGATWDARGTVLDRQLWDAHFVDTAAGWLVGVGGTILATTDGGATFTSQWAGTTRLHLCVRGASRTTAWLSSVGGFIARTTDGGSTWTAQGSGTSGEMPALAVVDDLHAWVGTWNGAGIAATSDGGASWIGQPIPAGASVDALAFADATHGWAVGHGAVLGTMDGGVTWSRQRVPFGPSRGCYGVSAVDADRAWIACRGILRTTTGGW